MGRSIPLLILVLLTSVNVNAQIIYTDVNPDQTFETDGDTCHLDVNNDGTDDFNILYHISSTGGCQCEDFFDSRPSRVEVIPLDQNAVGGYDAYGWATAMYGSETVGSSASWMTSTPSLMARQFTGCVISWGCIATSTNGYWFVGNNPDPDRYLPLRLKIAGVTHYGWVRGYVPYYYGRIPGFVLKDYAYEMAPDQPISAGALPVIGMADGDPVEPLFISPNPTSSRVLIRRNKGIDRSDAVFTVRSISSGALVSTGPFLCGQHSLAVDLSSLAAGVYVLEVLGQHTKAVGRILKE